MTSAYHPLASTNFSQNWSNTGLITTGDDWSGVPSIIGYRGDGLTGATGTDPQTLTADDTPPVVDVNANQTNPNTFATGGVAEFDIPDDTVALSGSGTADAPYLVLYLDASSRQNVVVSFNARDLDGSVDNAAQQIGVHYRVGATGVWTNLPAGYIPDASGGPSQATQVTPVSVTLPSAVDGEAQVQVRILTTNAVGNDEWVGIDDIHVASDPAGAPTTDVTIDDVSTAEGDAGTQTVTFTVTRSSNAEAFALDFTTAEGTAAEPGDFASASGPITFTAGGALSETIVVTINGDTTPEPNETFFVNLSNLVGPANVSIPDAQGQGTIVNDDLTPIYAIQGAAHASSLAGQSGVITRGIVTAVASNGFYIQDSAGDGNIATSDGIFVFTDAAPTVDLGDDVRVAGTVTEFVAAANNLGVTEITAPAVTVLSTGNPLPASTLIGAGGRLPPLAVIEDDSFASFDPTTDGLDFYESLEGMFVRLEGATSVSPTAHFGSSEEIWVTTVNDVASDNNRGGVTISLGDFNPQRVQIDDLNSLLVLPDVHVGATFGAITGVVHYSFTDYEVLVSAAPLVLTDPLTREVTTLAADATTLTFGSLNVENLDALDPPAKFAGLAEQIVDNLGAPTILAVQEIQDNNGATNDGTTDASLTAQALIDAIVTAGGPTYTYVDVAPANNTSGGEPGGNIRPGFLYRADVAAVVPGSLTTLDVPAFINSRDPLIAKFAFNGDEITFVNNHFTSKGGDNALFGVVQPPVLSSETSRIPQAQVVNDYVDGLLALDAAARVVVLGDLNDFSWSNPLRTLDGTIGGGTKVLFDLADETIADPAERYSYVFQGNSQELDHMYLTQGALALLGAFDIVHVNAEFFDQVSDHDPSVASLVVDQAATAIDDAFTTDEATAIGPGLNVFLANPTTPDSDPDSPLAVTALNGSAVDVGTPITLASGALLTLNADGTFAYDPNGAFDAVPGPLSGASNLTGTDSFTYALVAGGSATVTITISGLDSDDLLLGTAGNDRLKAGIGQDSLSGGTGDDFYFVEGTDEITEAAGDANDRVFATASYTLTPGASIEKMSTADHAGTDAIDLTGDAAANLIYGNAGDNRLDGAGGDDTLVGFGGDDEFVVDSQGDRVVETAGAGPFGGANDHVFASVSYALRTGSAVERLSTTDAAAITAINLTGNEIVNAITGNASPNTLNGRGGGDTLAGLGGNDAYVVDDALDIIVEAAGDALDRAFASATYTLGAGVSVEILSTTNHAGFSAIDLTGNAFANTVAGNAGPNILNGGDFKDTLSGFGGADIFLFDTPLNTGPSANYFVLLVTANVDYISDFDADDLIHLDDTTFGAIGATLDPAEFTVGPAASTSAHRIIHSPATGQLIYDADGDGSGGAFQFALLRPNQSLTEADFLMA